MPVFNPDPNHPVRIALVNAYPFLAMAIAYGLSLAKVKNFWIYVIAGGGLSWVGLSLAHIHPSLALIFIVPFMPFRETSETRGSLCRRKR